MSDLTILAGDLGGTKTVLALFSAEDGPRQPLVRESFPSRSYDSLEDMVHAFLQTVSQQVHYACFGVAGPVVGGRATITNLPWVLDEANLAAAAGLDKVHLLNDLEAVANAVPILTPEDLATLHPGAAAPTGAIGVIAPGTGLGQAFLIWDGAEYRAHPSEGGHVDFGPADDLQQELLAYLLPRMGHVSYERVCSGLGIPNLYAFLRDSGRYEEADWLAQALHEADDDTPVIVMAAQERESPLCKATLDLFIDILAREAGNLALKLMATGGIYIGGGIPPRILPQLRASNFATAFTHKGRFEHLLASIPVNVIINSDAALIGAAHDALHNLGGEHGEG